MTRFAETDAPTEAFRLPPPTVEQVDRHPDSAFIWSVILATRRDMRLTHDTGYIPYMEREVRVVP